MVAIPAGSFEMGSAEGEGYDDERPRHEVRIVRAFSIGKYPVTFDEYDAFAASTSRNMPEDQVWGRGGGPL